MNSVKEAIRSHVKGQPEGTIFVPKEFLALGTRASVDQALARLVKAGVLTRVSRGVYTANIATRFGTIPPPVELVVENYAAAKGQKILQNEAIAANRFGLTTQVPIRHVYITSGPSRRLQLGKVNVEVRKVPRWLTLYPGRPAGEIIRALSFVGASEAKTAASSIRSKVEKEEWRTVLKAKAMLPAWMTSALAQEGSFT
ncbi:DUF6088 family protein [Pleomorphomonas koreensis]|uniref:DUF6088 family protein n=1 Tax=Pleomorphomonas koreensis TaxID=257440 RepID=UPI00047D9390|nr:DUF6088 family protein [Pleomorphomonas koreensis]